MKGKGFAKGEPIGEGETPCFALGFVVSPSHIGSPFAGVAQNYIGHKRSVAKRKQDGKKPTYDRRHLFSDLCQFVQLPQRGQPYRGGGQNKPNKARTFPRP